MPEPNAALATPAPPQNDPSPATPDSSSAPSGTSSSPTADAPFLKVSDRQVYKTQDEAVRAYTEASNRIAQLSPWDALVKEGFTPQQVQQYLDELADRRAKETAAAQPTATPAATAPQMTPEWKAAIEYMKSLGVFPTTDTVTALKQQIEQLSQGQQGEHAARVEGARSNGEFILNNLIKDSGLTLDEKGTMLIANSVEDSIVRSSRDAQGNIIPNSPEDRFIRGDAAERTSIIKEQFNAFTQFGDTYAKRQTAALVDAKTAAQAANSRPLPASTSPVPTPATPGQGFKTKGINDAVAAAMAAELSRRGSGPLL